ncbi:hypothetical protein [Tabrizicola fusiformis]|uniref:hypothetical protein n=1 Tax=Tabrizicola sp. SY72 TaxID=2741673 RepID=UPI00157408F5|nr:hypothetical protein [Tabrizicola sp. SY72]NTT88535.1 hypothetical protein [Tabrizicola sp. SY72]
MISAVDKARAAWGPQVPDWVERLAEECMATSQNKVAARLNRSASLVSTVLGKTYAGSYEAVEEVVRGVYMRATVRCPAQGEIGANTCRDWMLKAARFSNINSERVRMYRACRACPRYRKEATDAA